jgi:DNA sulfur modification protein DndC
MTALFEKGEELVAPLLLLRASLDDGRNVSKNRMSVRRNGQEAVTEDGHNQGSYTEDYKAQILKEVLTAQYEVQKYKPEVELITNQELVAIQVIWHRELYFKYQVSDIYNNIFNKGIDMKQKDEKIQKEIDLLKTVCDDESSDFELIQELLIMQKNKALLNRKRGLKDDMERVIEKYINQAS